MSTYCSPCEVIILAYSKCFRNIYVFSPFHQIIFLKVSKRNKIFKKNFSPYFISTAPRKSHFSEFQQLHLPITLAACWRHIRFHFGRLDHCLEFQFVCVFGCILPLGFSIIVGCFFLGSLRTILELGLGLCNLLYIIIRAFWVDS